MFDRRSFLHSSLAAGMAAPALAQSPAESSRGYETITLWPGMPPGGEAVIVTQRSVRRTPQSPPVDLAYYGITRPSLTLVRPKNFNGTALLLVPGGGYERVATSPEGGPFARYFANRGFMVGSLIYRLPYDGWAAGPGAPLQDAQRAFRLLKREAGEQAKVGVIGFSAGGHLAGSLASRFSERTYDWVDSEDNRPARPDFAGLLYPVVTMTDPHAHGPSRRHLIGRDPSPEMIRAWSLERNIPADMPPTFLAAAVDDKSVPVENSTMLFSALSNRKVPCAMHIFDTGGHGFGRLTDKGGPGRYWPELFLDWLSRQTTA